MAEQAQNLASAGAESAKEIASAESDRQRIAMDGTIGIFSAS